MDHLVGKPKYGKLDRAITEAARTRQALELRLAGLTFEQIAQRLGYANKSGAYKAIARALRERVAEPAEALRAVQQARIEALISSHWPAAQGGDLRATDRVIKLLEREAKLLALDQQPEQGSAHGVPLKPYINVDIDRV
jgi:hypothetical protein